MGLFKKRKKIKVNKTYDLLFKAEKYYEKGKLSKAIDLMCKHIKLGLKSSDWQDAVPPKQFSRLPFWLEKAERYQDAIDVIDYWNKVRNKASNKYKKQNQNRYERLKKKAGSDKDKSTGGVVPF